MRHARFEAPDITRDITRLIERERERERERKKEDRGEREAMPPLARTRNASGNLNSRESRYRIGIESISNRYRRQREDSRRKLARDVAFLSRSASLERKRETEKIPD